MIDLATLNLKIDSREVREGVGQLDKLTAAGTRAEAATDRLEAGFDSAATSAGRLTQAEARLTAANDRFGASIRGANTASRAMQANMVNLSRQGADVVTMFAMGASPMQIFATQGLQIADVLAMMNAEAKATNTSLTAMAGGGLARLGPYALAAAAAAGVLGSAVSVITDEINENSAVTVTWQDTVLGAYDAVRSYVANQMTAVFEAWGVSVEGVLRSVVDFSLTALDRGLGPWVVAGRMIIAAFRTFPAALGEIFINAANAAIQAIEDMVNRGIDALNGFANVAEDVTGLAIGRIANIDIGEIENRFRGAGNAAGVAMGEATNFSFRQFFEGLADEISPFAEERARDRMAADAEEAGTRAGRALGSAVRAQIDPELEDAMRKAAEAAEIEADRIRNNKAAEAEAAANLQDKIKAEVGAHERIQDEARRLEEDRIREMADLYQALFTRGIDGLWDYFKKQGLDVLSTLASQWTLSLLSGGGGGTPVSGVMSMLGGGAANDNGPVGILARMLGGSTGAVASGGPIGMAVAAMALSSSIGSGIGKLIGTGYNKTAGGLFGIVPGLIGGLLGGTPKGVANLSGTSILSSSGKLSGQASAAGGSVLETIAQIADALGATASGGAVSVGIKGKNFRVDPTGQGRVKGAGVIDFGKDQQAAIEYAIRDLIQDGVLGGISQAAKNLLGAGGDLEKAIEQAMLIESVPKLLKERLDPLGAALDGIDERFGKLVEALRAGGATAQQFADAERLYNLEREEAIAQIGSAAQTLKDFAASLAYGSNSPLSVRSQLASARSALAGLDPTKDQEKYVAAAQQVLALSRQANGSSGAYFADFNAINGQLQGAISSIESRTTTAGPGTVFQQQTASNTATMAQMLQDHTALLRSIDAKLGANDNAAVSGSFIGSTRGFG